MQEIRKINHYYVDEAGDLTLFNKHGRIVIGKKGVSRLFMVGMAYLPNPKLAKDELEKLRSELLADPYFKDVPSLQPSTKKTAILFHAKDDLPEVRREIFRLLPKFGAKIQIAIKRKEYLIKTAQLLYRRKSRLSSNDVYDDLIKRLFKNSLHTAQKNKIIFAQRGKSARQQALEEAIRKAKSNFERKTGISSDSETTIFSGYPSQYAGLQVIDYYLWALQRMFERGEDRFFHLLAPSYRLIMDLDDTRNKPYGEWYSDSNPLDLKKIKPVVG